LNFSFICGMFINMRNQIRSGQLAVICALFLCLFLSLLFYSYPSDRSCFTIASGKKATEDGSVIMAHNEDDEGKNFFVNMHKIQRKSVKKNPAKDEPLQPIDETTEYLWIEIPDTEFGDSYMNEHGVTIASNACESREDKHLLPGEGIGFMLRRIVAERATSSRQAVEIAGMLIQHYGYNSPGRSYAIADPKEAWILQVAKGKHWIAKRVPDNHVAVVANRYTIEAINLNDKANYLGSPDIIQYAVKRGWYTPKKDGEFNFAKVYSAPGNYSAEENVLRQWRGTSLLSKNKIKVDDRLPFSFEPKKNLRIPDFFRVLRDHYEGTEYDLTEEYKLGSPNTTAKRTICTKSTQYAFVAQLRDYLPIEYANLAWISFRNPDTNAFSPWYYSITCPPEGYTHGNSENAIELHFKRPDSFFSFSPFYAFWNFSRLSSTVEREYRNRIKIVKKEWSNFEDYVLKTQKRTEREFSFLVKQNKFLTLKLITNHVHKLEYQKWYLASELIARLAALISK